MNRWGSIESINTRLPPALPVFSRCLVCNKHAKQNGLDRFVKDLQYRAFLKEKSLLLTLKVYVSGLSLLSTGTLFFRSLIQLFFFKVYFISKCYCTPIYTAFQEVDLKIQSLFCILAVGRIKSTRCFFNLNSHRVKMLRVIFNKTPIFEELEWMSFVILKQHGIF